MEFSTGNLLNRAQRYRNFSSNDYLGLSHHPVVIQAWQQEDEYYRVGRGSNGHADIVGFTISLL